MRSLLEGLIAAFGVEVEIEIDPDRFRSVDQQVFYGDSAKARSETGWGPITRSSARSRTSRTSGARGFGGTREATA
jgi:hypothetical protein